MENAATHLVGRETELTALEALLKHNTREHAVVLSGIPGIGKTTLLEATVELARAHGYEVLVARPAESEAKLSFAGLADLLDSVGEDILLRLPEPQHRALAVALLRVEPFADQPPAELAIATGLLGILRQLAASGSVLIAVDDSQWLDKASASALAFAVRRIAGPRVRILLAVREGSSSALEPMLAGAQTRYLPLAPLDLEATRHLLSRRGGLILPAAQLRRIFETAQGNPLVVLELGRILLEQGSLDGTQGPSDQLAARLFADRIAQMEDQTRAAALAMALSPQISEAELAAACGNEALEHALDAGVLIADQRQLRAAHPLLSAAVLAQTTAQRQRAMHLELARAVEDELRAAYHLAMGTVGRDAERATTLAGAARLALRRGAGTDAVELARHALALTPLESALTAERVLELAECMFNAGDLIAAGELLEAELARLPQGAPLARAHLLLAEVARDIDEHGRHLELALAESASEPDLAATALAMKAQLFAVIRVERLREAERYVEEGLTLPVAQEGTVRRLEAAHAWVMVMTGMAVENATAQPSQTPDGRGLYETSLERPAAVQLGFRGELAGARERVEALLQLAEERGEAIARAVVHHNLCELGLRAGEIQYVGELLGAWDSWGFEEQATARARCEALLAAIAGDRGLAIASASKVLAASELRRWDRLEAQRALGLVALLENDAATAVTHFAPIWEHTEREHVDDPGAFPVAPDLVEALAELDRVQEAQAVTIRLAELARSQDHPWGLASAERCAALLALTSGYSERAAEGLTRAAERYGELGLRFDRSRTLLLLGRAQRRYKKWGRARDALEQAASAFAELGADGWAQRARSELARVGARRPGAAGKLTPAEQRVVELAIAGLSNKDIARELVVSVHTIEVHLSHAYAKLGIRSRSQLARAVATSA
ncbi:MAG: AAA family ATPase [Solirubrobacteraceae bacterium]